MDSVVTQDQIPVLLAVLLLWVVEQAYIKVQEPQVDLVVVVESMQVVLKHLVDQEPQVKDLVVVLAIL
jgi:hypothetical protein